MGAAMRCTPFQEWLGFPFRRLLMASMCPVIATTAAAAPCGSFVDIGAALTGVSLSAAGWGDFDSDGDLDILLTGQTSTGRVAIVYRNDGGSFVNIGSPLTGVYFSSVAWGDYDNDGEIGRAACRERMRG